jgi:hypothetical protein
MISVPNADKGNPDARNSCVVQSFPYLSMKKAVLIVAVLVAAGVGYFIFQSNSSTTAQSAKSATTAGTTSGISAGKTAEGNAEKHRPRATAGDAAEKIIPSSGKAKVTTHQAVDFNKGQLQNTILNDGLQIGSDASFAPRWAPYKMFGIYTSPDDVVMEPFEALVPDCDLTGELGNTVTFEFRTRPADGDWTVWQEVTTADLGKPVYLSAPAVSWQYRINIYANEAANSPKVRGITITTGSAQTIAQAAPAKTVFPPSNTSSQQ